MAETITLEQLEEKMADPNTPVEELHPYLIRSDDKSRAFAPAFAPNPELVKLPKPDDLTEEEFLSAASPLTGPTTWHEAGASAPSWSPVATPPARYWCRRAIPGSSSRSS